MAPATYHAHESPRHLALDGTPLASFGQRVVGFVVDLTVVVALWAPLELLWARFVSREWDGPRHFEIHFSLHEWRSLAVAQLYYVTAFYFTNGRSLGKWIARTRVLSLTHERMGLWQSVERVFGYAAAAAEGIGFLQYFWSDNRMCVQDRIAETIVADTRRHRRHLGTAGPAKP